MPLKSARRFLHSDTRPDFNIEKTAIGMQYVIPGTERPTKPKRRLYKADGNTTYSMARNSSKKVGEVIISGGDRG